MDALAPGHYWKTPFVWEPGASPTAESSHGEGRHDDRLMFTECDPRWLESAVARVMATSRDRAERNAVERFGADHAARNLLTRASEHFHVPPGWWRTARDRANEGIGFVLPVLFREEDTRKGGRPEATILYLGLLPQFRGRGDSVALLHEAVRVVRQADCWQLLCDTDSDNLPMVRAFRRAGFAERKPWPRPFE